MTWQPTIVADPLSALVAHLRTALAASTSGRVFGEQLPGSETSSMPRAGVLLRSAGGPGAARHAPLLRIRVDVHAYGATPYSAMLVHWAAYAALRDVNRLLVGSTLLHACEPESGPIAQTDAETEWPEVVSSWLVTAAEHVPV